MRSAEKWGPGLVITNFKDQSAYDVVICAHMDTVQPVGNAAKHPLTVEGTIARGAGAGDDKASLNAVWYICRELPKDVTEKLRMCVLLSPAEEVGPAELNDFLLEYGKRAKYALVYEPGRPRRLLRQGPQVRNWSSSTSKVLPAMRATILRTAATPSMPWRAPFPWSTRS